jgi:hypothetical protein
MTRAELIRKVTKMIARFRIALTLAILVVTPLGFAAKFWYRRPFDHVVADYGAGSLYDVFWILVVLWICPRVSIAKVALGVFFVTPTVCPFFSPRCVT